MLVDELKIKVKAGDGGNGIVSWKRWKYIAKGGPGGGDGGKGGDVYFRTIRDVTVLSKYKPNPKFKAKNGGHGRRMSKHGENGEDLYIDLPVGSVVTNLSTGEKFTLLKEGEERKILKGGWGGYGNEHFKSSRNTTPEIQTDGKPGEEAEFLIELELVVDLGLIGLPSAGKSSLLNTITGAKSKVAEYHFTTLEPHLGSFHKYIIADIPGLIEGASEGKGLGYKFLKHIKRTRALAHLVSFEYKDMISEYKKIRKELEKYSEDLIEKPEIIVLSKSDLVSDEEAEKKKKEFEKETGKKVILFSILKDDEIKNLEKEFLEFLKK